MLYQKPIAVFQTNFILLDNKKFAHTICPRQKFTFKKIIIILKNKKRQKNINKIVMKLWVGDDDMEQKTQENNQK